VGAVVVTICNGTSFDELLHNVPQKGVKGVRVATYVIGGSFRPLRNVLKHAPEAQEQAAAVEDIQGDYLQLLQDIWSVQAHSVTFNWESCSACADDTFGLQEETRTALKLTRLLLERGHMVVFSDFSLNALIRWWDEALLGPCPFVKIAEHDGEMELRFDIDRVKACPSAQLQRLGDLSRCGRAYVLARDNNIVFNVDQALRRNGGASGWYDLQVLSVVTGLSEVAHLPEEALCELDKDNKGAAGHVLLTYPSGGRLLAAAGRWSDLVHMDTTEGLVLQTVKEQYGEDCSERLSRRLVAQQNVPTERSRIVQSAAILMVQASTPGGYLIRSSPTVVAMLAHKAKVGADVVTPEIAEIVVQEHVREGRRRLFHPSELLIASSS